MRMSTIVTTLKKIKLSVTSGTSETILWLYQKYHQLNEQMEHKSKM